MLKLLMCKTPEGVQSLCQRLTSAADAKTKDKLARLDRQKEDNDARTEVLAKRQAALAAEGRLVDESKCKFQLFFVTPLLTLFFALFWFCEYKVILFTLKFFPFIEQKYNELLALALAVMTPIAGDFYLHSIGFKAHDPREFFAKRLLQITAFVGFLTGLTCISILGAFRAAVYVTDMEIKYGRVKEYRFLVGVAKFFIPLVIVGLAVGVASLTTVLLFHLTETVTCYWPSYAVHLGLRRASRRESRITEGHKRIDAWNKDKIEQIARAADQRKDAIGRKEGKENKFARWWKNFFYGNGELKGGEQK